MKKILVILGPTATGKTDLALKIAQKFNGEIIACDSRQVYTSLDIGTGKLPSEKSKVKKGKGFWEINSIKIWLYDVVSPKKQYTVADYVKDAVTAINNIEARGKLPIIVGGTGLYLRAITQGIPSLNIPIDKKLRGELAELTLKELQDKLTLLSPTRWKKMNNSDRQNPRRLLRSIELFYMNPYMDTKEQNIPLNEYNILKIGLTAPREVLYKKADLRVINRINQGMIKEAIRIKKEGISFKRMRSLGLEYGVLADYLEGKIKSIDELVNCLQLKIHGYIRRQLTWFKKETNIYWIDFTDKNYLIKVEKLVAKWYIKPNAT